MRIPRIKVCGVTRAEDLTVLTEAGVDSVGFNFVACSPRCLDLALARELCRLAGESGLQRVAVVMDLAGDELTELLSAVDVDFIQLHGSELPEIAAACMGLPIIKAISWSGRPEESALVEAWMAATSTHASGESALAAWLVDAYAPQMGGGTGRTADWQRLRPRPLQFGQVPLILAGGLQPHNVAAAILATGADGVDTASGVEVSPGVKSAELVRQFASAVDAAL